MTIGYPLYTFALAAICLLSIYLGLYARQRPEVPGSHFFSWVMLAVSEYAGMNFLITITPLEHQELGFVFARMRAIGASTAPIFLLLFALEYTEQTRKITPRRIMALFLIPVVTQVVVWFFPHDFYFKVWELIHKNGISLENKQFTGWFWIHFAYIYITASTALVHLTAYSRKTSPYLRQQSLWIIAGTLIFLIFTLPISLGFTRGINLAPIGGGVVGLTGAWALFRHQLLDVVPIAYDTIFNNMRAGMIVVDMQNRVVMINPWAKKLVNVPLKTVIGQPIEHVFPEQISRIRRYQDVLEAYEEVLIGEGDQTEVWEFTITPLYRRGQQLSGRLITIHNITETKVTKASLLRQNDMLTTLQDISLDLLNRRSRAELLQTIVDRAAAILDAPYTELMLIEGDELVVSGFTQNQTFLAGDRAGRNEALVSWQAFDTGQPVIMDDYSAYQHKRDVYSEINLCAIADFPIMVGQTCHGVLALGRTKPNYPFSKEQQQLGIYFSQLAAVILDNVNLYEAALHEIRERKQSEALTQAFLSDMRALQTLQLELSEIDDLETLYQRMVELTNKRLGIERLGLFLIDHKTNRLQGTYGIDQTGSIRDERYYQETITPDHWTSEIFNSPNHVKFWAETTLYDNGILVGTGWKVAATLWDGHEAIGYLVCDNFITQQPARPYQAELISILGSTLGHLIRLKQSADHLRQSENRFRTVFEASPIGKALASPQAKWLQVNPAICEMLGYSHEELLGIDFRDITHPDDIQKNLDFFERALAGEISTYRLEKRYIHKEGRIIWVILTATLVRDAQNEPQYFITQIVDITEIKQLEESLRLLDRAVNYSPAGLVIAANEPELPAMYVNDVFIQMTGYEREAFLGNSLRFLQREDRQQQGLEEIRIAVREQRPNKALLRTYRKDGSMFWNEVWIAPVFDDNHRLTHFVTTQLDVTERIEAEQQQIKLLNQIEAANRDLKDFAYIVSHDLKAPLRGIGSIANWLTTDYQDRLDDEGRELLSLLNGRVKRMDALINGILEYSRIGRTDEEYTQVDLKELIPQIIDLVVPHERFHVHVDDRLPIIQGDPFRLQQVFQNLISNAVKYMDKPHGEIYIICQDQPQAYQFGIRDNGSGIEERHFARIFQIFQTLAARDDHESTGIGLTIVKRIIENYGGTIWVESIVHEGSTFYFTLPKGNSHETH